MMRYKSSPAHQRVHIWIHAQNTWYMHIYMCACVGVCRVINPLANKCQLIIVYIVYM